MAAEEAELDTALFAAQGAYAATAGPDRASVVLGISVTAARTLAKNHDTRDEHADQGSRDGVQHEAYASRSAGPAVTRTTRARASTRSPTGHRSGGTARASTSPASLAVQPSLCSPSFKATR